ncbi:MAG: pirin family protein [Lentisphaeria bacterium]|nr:pirin family protein [Lentisphaeria bacterium]NQZ70267.1 pirin family protein [Lentisphaeria bacterium]
MKQKHRSDDRGKTDIGWLKSYHSFSFGEYYDPKNMQFGPLRVLNDDVIAAGAGFPTHPHRDMEIITYMISGALEHKDSTGNSSTIRSGDVQVMSAGTGIRHSEANPSSSEETRLIQTWIEPNEKNLTPGWEEKNFSQSLKLNRLQAIASGDGRDDSLQIHQDAVVYASILEAETQLEHELDLSRQYWLQVISGNMDVNGLEVREGDAMAISAEQDLIFIAKEQTEFLLFDLA